MDKTTKAMIRKIREQDEQLRLVAGILFQLIRRSDKCDHCLSDSDFGWICFHTDKRDDKNPCEEEIADCPLFANARLTRR